MKTLKRIIEYLYDDQLLPVKKHNIPNFITLFAGAWFSRISLGFFYFLFVYAMTSRLSIVWVRATAIALSGLASFSDCLDGYIARKFGWVSQFGEVFDPHVDKIQYTCKSLSLIFDCLAMFAITHDNYFLILLAIIMPVSYICWERDMSSMFHRLLRAIKLPHAKLNAKSSGKWRTRICFAGLPTLHLFIWPFVGLTVPIYICACMLSITIYSYIDYVRLARRVIREGQQQLETAPAVLAKPTKAKRQKKQKLVLTEPEIVP